MRAPPHYIGEMDAQPLSNRETPDEKIAASAKPARRKRWWWQFSLRSLMLFVLVVAGRTVG